MKIDYIKSMVKGRLGVLSSSFALRDFSSGICLRLHRFATWCIGVLDE